jgi:hypothetical protein
MRNYGMLAGPNESNSRPARVRMLLSKYFDRVAIALSTICIVHCLAMPFVIALLPVAAFTIGGDGHFHSLMLWFVVPTSVLGFGLGLRVHRRTDIVLLGAAAIVTLAIAALWGHSAWDPSLEVLVNVAASIVLAAAHWRNFREVRRLHNH